MPRKANTLTDEERAKRIRETAEEIGTSNNPEDLERAFGRVTAAKPFKSGEGVVKKVAKAPPPRQEAEKPKTKKR
ncbi:MAG: hypothetical protein WBX25_24990 [Rhodomicrobium sp.]